MKKLKLFILILCFGLVSAQNDITNLKINIDKKIDENPYIVNVLLKKLPSLKYKFKNIKTYDEIIDFLNDYRTNKLGLNYNDKYALSQIGYYYLDNHFDNSVIKPNNTLPTPNFDKLFITFIKDGKIRCCQSGKTLGDMDKYISEAVEACINDERFGGKITKDEIKDITIEMSFLYDHQSITSKNFANIKSSIEPGIHGLEIRNGKNIAFYKETVQISSNYDTKTALDQLCKKAKLKAGCYMNSDTLINIYHTFSFLTNREGNIQNLYRYNLLQNMETISQDKIYERINLITKRYKNNINPENGMVNYLYYPSKDSYEKKENNHIRNLASIRCMGSLDTFFGSGEFQKTAKTTLEYYLKYKISKDGYDYLDINGVSSIANNAFVILSLLNINEFTGKDEIMNSFAKGIIAMQQKDGSFNTNFKSDKNSGVDFYPGEAMLALMKLYEYSQNEEYLTSVDKAFDYYATYWRGNKNTAFIPWQTQTDYLLYKYTKNQKVADFIFEMNDWIIENHQTVVNDYLDKIGGFSKTDQRISTASYMEGINRAYELAVLLNDTKHIEYYKNSLKQATRFLLQLQYTDENSFYLANPERSIGGFKQTLINNQLRNDNAQHAAFALMGLWENKIF